MLRLHFQHIHPQLGGISSATQKMISLSTHTYVTMYKLILDCRKNNVPQDQTDGSFWFSPLAGRMYSSSCWTAKTVCHLSKYLQMQQRNCCSSIYVKATSRHDGYTESAFSGAPCLSVPVSGDQQLEKAIAFMTCL